MASSPAWGQLANAVFLWFLVIGQVLSKAPTCLHHLSSCHAYLLWAVKLVTLSLIRNHKS